MRQHDEDRPALMDALGADGSVVRLRAVSAGDEDGLTELHRDSSPESLRARFFAPGTEQGVAQEVARLVRPADPDHDAVVAEQGGALVGVASYERAGDGDKAEFAVFVDEDHHGRGIGTLLLEFLAARAANRGIRTLVGDVLATNGSMLRVARGLSDGSGPRYADGVVDVTVATSSEVALAELDRRDRSSRARSLRALLAPRSVAVVGASRSAGGIGHAVLRGIVDGGFRGGLHVVNPTATPVLDVPAVATFGDLVEPVDLVVICVPAPAVAGVLDEAGQHGVRAAVVITAGFGESGPDGRAAQAELVRVARRHGIRLVGPNCLGVLNTDPQVALAATFAPVLPPPGGLALASQSGAVGVAVLEHAARTGSGVSTFVSLGNKADVSGNDLLSYWFDDPATSAVALYLESFGNPRRFARIARAVARRKPVIAVVSGRSVAGRRAGASHTAAAASPAVAVDALCQQAGVIRVDHLGELLDVARLATDQPLPAGGRIAIVGNAGGVNVLAADAAEPTGLTMPEFSLELRQRLHAFVDNAANPLDLGAGANPTSFAAALDLVAASGEVDSVVAVVASTSANDVPETLAALAAVIDRHSGLPAVVVVLGGGTASTVGDRKVPVFDLPERAIAAMGKVAAYAEWRRTPLGAYPELAGVDSAVARSTVRAGVAAGGGWQPHGRIAEVLGRYGIPVIPTATVIGVQAAVAQASRFGFPVALKAADPQLVHKSDVGAVHLRLGGPDAVASAYRQIAAALNVPEPAVLVQPMASGAVELVAGIVHDPLFGSLVMVGLGGVQTELFDDRAFRLVPMTDRDAGAMWRSLRAAPLLTGFRGSEPVDTAAVEDLLLRLGRLAQDRPEIAELDLNPIIVSAAGVTVVDAKMRLTAVAAEPAATVRALNP